MKRAFVVLFTLTLTACNNAGTDTGNAMDIAVRAVSSTNPGVETPEGPDAQGTTLTLLTAVANVDELEFDLPEGQSCADYDPALFEAPVYCETLDGDDGFAVDGPFIVNLITGASNPSLTGLTIPPELYRRVEVGFEQGDSEDGLIPPGDPLDGATIVATGTLDYNAQTLDFDLSLEFGEEARFENVDGTTARNILLSLDVAAWFATLPITQCLDDGDLVPVGNTLSITDGGGGCSALEEALKNAIKDSAELEEDDD